MVHDTRIGWMVERGKYGMEGSGMKERIGKCVNASPFVPLYAGAEMGMSKNLTRWGS
jgi:hypothetical protein